MLVRRSGIFEKILCEKKILYLHTTLFWLKIKLIPYRYTNVLLAKQIILSADLILLFIVCSVHFLKRILMLKLGFPKLILY